MTNYSSSITNLRSTTGLTQKAFSDRFHIPIRTLQDWESGRRNPPPYVLELLEYRILSESDT